ncbi:MAG: anaerobic carbon-monoxide dehydrogenase catalytic subunit [Bacillota bacterium]
MNVCHTCTSASCYSAHKSTNEMYERTRNLGITTVFDRWEAQQPQCGFGLQGLCCQLCSHGPCRITARADRGICGATADTIVARNLVRLAVHGAAAYAHHLEELARTLKATAKGQTPFRIGDPGKLREVANLIGLDTRKSDEQLAVALSDAILSELRKGSDERLSLVDVLAPASRKKAWEDLGVIPGGVLSEIRDALTKSMTNINTDPTDLLLTAIRLSLATGYMGLVGTVTVQDILLGSPAIVESEADLGIIDPETVNIVAHGHVPFMATAVIQASKKPELLDLAREAGASGIKVYGSMCTGQELMQRSATSTRGFAGQLGNWLAQEYYVATGAVDLVMMDMNCSIPGLKTAADHFHTRLVSVDRIVRMDGVKDHVDYDPEKVADQAVHLVRMAIDAFKDRLQNVYIPSRRARVVAGFGIESILKALGGSLDPLLDVIKAGSVRGIAAVVGCTNNRNGHDFKSLTIMREFLKNNVLVISAGCTSSGAQIESLMDPASADVCGEKLRDVCKALGIPPVLNFGSCVDIGRIGAAVTAIADTLGVDPSQLPVAASAPEYLEQKAVADGIFAVSFGLLTHIGPVPPVTGSELVTKVLTEDIENLLGGKVLVEEDPVKAASIMVSHIDAKRKALGI